MKESRVASPESREKLKNFIVRTVRNEQFSLQAEYITRGSHLNAPIYFWIRGTHWYSRRCCVGIVEWQLVLTVALEKDDNVIAKELGVRI